MLVKMKAALAAVKAEPFAVKFSGVGFFPNAKEARVFWIVAKGLPEFSNGGVDAVLGLNENILAPEFFNDLFATNKVAVPTYQQDEQLHGNFFKLQHTAVAA